MQTAAPEPFTSFAFRFPHLSSRLFVLDRQRFITKIHRICLHPPAPIDILQAWIGGNPAYELPEELFTKAMAEHHLFRVDFLGHGAGMWSVHPPYRSETFYQKLPEIIQKIETGDIPETQRGDHDLNDSLIDWTDARIALQKKYWLRRSIKRLIA
jgi:hypothetical protein